MVRKTADTLTEFPADYMFTHSVAESKTQPCITFVESCSGAVISFMCAKKEGPGNEDLTRGFLCFFESYAFLNPVIVHCDEEMSIIDVCRELVRERRRELCNRSRRKQIIRATGLSQQCTDTYKDSHDAAETQIKTNTGMQHSATSLAIPFAVRYVGFVLTRFNVRPDGRTSFQ